MKVQTGLDRLATEAPLRDLCVGRIGYLCHAASVNHQLQHGIDIMVRLFGKRLTAIFGPQHGFTTDLQDNMIESGHTEHPLYQVPVFSLYSETRQPTDEMLDLIDTLVIDLQDVGTRVYTYIWTLYLCMEACARRGIRVVVTDRPNPAGGIRIEGNLPDPDYHSFVCMAPIPMRHALTIAEMALFFRQTAHQHCDLQVIEMKGWERWMLWTDTKLEWINPSPNLPVATGTLVYPGSVLIEGTTLSEGRGTTRSLELFGHPAIEPFALQHPLTRYLHAAALEGFVLRPLIFIPVAQKHQGKACGGFQIHVTNASLFRPWLTVQLILKFLWARALVNPLWHSDPYEYQFERLAIDWINGTDRIRLWTEQSNENVNDLLHLENEGLTGYAYLAQNLHLYRLP